MRLAVSYFGSLLHSSNVAFLDTSVISIIGEYAGLELEPSAATGTNRECSCRCRHQLRLLSVARSSDVRSRLRLLELRRTIRANIRKRELTSSIRSGPLPALHAISLYTTLSTRRSISDTLSGRGQHQSITGARSHNDGNLTPGAGPAFRLSTFKRTGDASSSSYALRSKRDSPPPLQVNVQREQTVSFDVRSEYDEEYSVEKAERL